MNIKTIEKKAVEFTKANGWSSLQTRAFILGYEITSFHLDESEFVEDVTNNNFTYVTLPEGVSLYEYYGAYILRERGEDVTRYSVDEVEELGAYEIHDAPSDVDHVIEVSEEEYFIYGVRI